MVKCCPTCGHPVPESEVHAALTKTQRRIYDAVRTAGTAGIELRDLLDKIYDGIDEPEFPEITTRTCIMKARKRLRPFGLEIRGSGGPGSRYYLRKLEGAQ